MGRGKKKDKASAPSSIGGKTDSSVIDLVVENVSVGIWPPYDEEDGSEFQEDPFVNEGLIVKQRLERCALHKDMIYGVTDILTPEECQAWINWGERMGFLEAKQAASAGYAHRDNGRLARHSPEVAERIFHRVRQIVPKEIHNEQTGSTQVAVGCSPNIRLYRYVKGQRFGKHIDESCFEESSQAWSEFTLLFYLNDNLQGGETVFYKGNTGAKEVLRVPPKAGAALLHWHGDRCLLHEGAAVREGVKYLLRTDVLYR